MLESLSIVFIAFGGFLLSLYLFHKKRSKSEPFVCPLRGKCSEVIHSGYSRFLAIPVEILGMIYYATASIGHGFLLAFPETFAWSDVPLLFASVVALLFSLYLTFIQIVALRKLCTWCLLSATFCLLIFGLTVLNTLDFVLPLLVEYQSVIVALHSLSIALGTGISTLAGVFFFKFLKDTRISKEEADTLSILSEFIWLALGVIVITGAALYFPQYELFAEAPRFIAEMIVVSVIIVNGAFLNLYIAPKLVRISFVEPHHHKEGELGRARRVVFALGPTSIVSWYCVFILNSLATTTHLTFWTLIKVYLLLIVTAITVGQFIENRFSRRGVPWPTT